jgi:hypothetical protein
VTGLADPSPFGLPPEVESLGGAALKQQASC